MTAMGNGTDDSRAGLIFPKASNNSFVVVRYINSGYVKDDEARNWKADEMLTQMKEGTETGNKQRVEHGIPEMELVGWVQTPQYEEKNHRLVWSIESKDKGSPANSPHGINYNTFVLGREGYVSLNLVTGMNTVAQEKSHALALLDNTSFNSGKGYGDFNASTDKVAEYGIAALVAGVAAKKLGLLAVIGVFLAKFAKIIGLAAIGGLAFFRKFFNRNKSAT